LEPSLALAGNARLAAGGRLKAAPFPTCKINKGTTHFNDAPSRPLAASYCYGPAIPSTVTERRNYFSSRQLAQIKPSGKL